MFKVYCELDITLDNQKKMYNYIYLEKKRKLGNQSTHCDPATSITATSMKQDFPSFLLMKNCLLILQDCTFSIWIWALILSWWAEWFKDIAKRTTTVFRVHQVQERVLFPYDINNKRSLHSKRPNALMQSHTFDRSAGFNCTERRDWWTFARLFHPYSIPVCKSLCQEYKYAFKTRFPHFHRDHRLYVRIWFGLLRNLILDQYWLSSPIH